MIQNNLPSKNPSPSWLKVWIAIHLGLTLLAVPVLLAMLLAGLVHANDREIGRFLLGPLALVAVVFVAPLALLRPENGPLWVLAKGVGAIALLGGSAGSLWLFGVMVVKPLIGGWRYDSAMNDLRMAVVQEEPVLVHGRPAGLRVVVELELPQAVRLDRQGMSTIALMNSLSVQLKKVKPGLNVYSPFETYGPSEVTLDGKRLEELPGLARALGNGASGDPSATLPAGRYRIAKVFWRYGLQGTANTNSDASPGPTCFTDFRDPARVDADLAQLQGRALEAVLATRFDVTERRNYRDTKLQKPLKYANQYIPLATLHDQLRLPNCAQKQREDQAQAQAQKYLEGDGSEVYKLLCDGDEKAVRALLALGPPKYVSWARLSECTVEKPRGEMFSLLLPHAVAQSQEGANASRYCALLAGLHNTGNLEFLTRIADLQLPMVCEGADAELWRNGFDPSMPSPSSGPRKPARPLNDSTELAWLKLMKAQGLPICKPAKSGITLLQLSVKHRSADVIEFLLDAGCDPHATAPENPILEGGKEGSPARVEVQPILPVAGWTLRRFRSPKSVTTSPIDPDRVDAITRRMGTMRADEINRVEPSVKAPFLVAHRAVVLFNPALFQHLVQQGARLDVTDATGLSWFNYVSDDKQLGDPKEKRRGPPFAMFDSVSDAKMRELLRPGPKALQQLSFDDRSATSFNTYLCKRKLGPCAQLTR